MESTPNDLAQSLRTAAAMRPRDAEDCGAACARQTNQPASQAPHWVQRLTARSLGEGPYEQQGGPAATTLLRSGGCSPEHTNEPAVDALDALLAGRRSDVLPGPATAVMALASLHAVGTTKTLRYDRAGRLWQSRRQPSAGGTHSIEPLLHARHVEGLNAGWYTQSGFSRGDVAEVLVPDEPRLSAAVRDALSRDTSPAAVVYAVCEPDLLGARYPQGSSLLWRDAGAFTMVVHLLAHAHGLTSTILGLCVELDQHDVGVHRAGSVAPHVVGAVAIGGPYPGATVA